MVHVTSGVSALVTALYLGKRVGYPKVPIAAALGGVQLCGCGIVVGGLVRVQCGLGASCGGRWRLRLLWQRILGAAAAACGWSAAEWIRNGKPSALGAISGAVAGLVGITPAAGFVTPISALWIGLIVGVFCYFMVVVVKNLFGYDDSLDAFGVHGAGGTMGAILTGIFAKSVINPVFKDAKGNALPSGVLEGNGHQLLNQLTGVGIAWMLSIVGTLIILLIVDKTIGMRVNEDDEREGLDLTQHGEEGYDWAH